jgi:site-specific recombinase XerD
MTLGKAITRYIEHGRHLGKGLIAESTILRAFCRQIGDVPLRKVSAETVEQFLDAKGKSNNTISRRHRALAGFFRFAVSRQLLNTSPMPRFLRRLDRSFSPHIYSRAELKRLIRAVPVACSSHAQTDADTLRTFLLLLYGAGLRRSEALNLKLADFDAQQSLLHIRATKFFKSRIVPLSVSLCAVMRAYRAKRTKRYRADLNSSFFCKRNGEALTGSCIATAFCRLRVIAGICRGGGPRRQPRMHDLRHSAAVHRVVEWYRSGANVNHLLPKLATYLGHKDLSGTQHYLTMTHELLGEASSRFEAFAEGSSHE